MEPIDQGPPPTTWCCFWRRLVAATIDSLVVTVPFVVFWSATGRLEVRYANDITFSPGWRGYLLLWFTAIVYWTVLEAARGRTPGKRLCRIRVVREDGTEPGWGRCTLRNVLRIVDQFMCLVVGPLFMLTTTRRQRLGDLAARTLVVRDLPSGQGESSATPSRTA